MTWTGATQWRSGGDRPAECRQVDPGQRAGRGQDQHHLEPAADHPSSPARHRDVPRGQLQLVDTPGIHGEKGKRSGKAMNRMMNRAARGALDGVDAAVLVIEAGRWDEEDGLAFDALHEGGLPVVLVVNQVDKFKDKARCSRSSPR